MRVMQDMTWLQPRSEMLTMGELNLEPDLHLLFPLAM